MSNDRRKPYPEPHEFQRDRWYHMRALLEPVVERSKYGQREFDIKHASRYENMLFDLVEKTWDPDTDTFNYRRVANVVRLINLETVGKEAHWEWYKNVTISEGARIRGRIVAFYIHPDWDAIQTAAELDHIDACNARVTEPDGDEDKAPLATDHGMTF